MARRAAKGRRSLILEALEPRWTPATVSVVANIAPDANDSNPADLVNVNGTLYFAARGAGGEELWRSDGTESGTRRVKDIRDGGSGSEPFNLTNVNGTLFFVADDGFNGPALWKSDGTEDGTVLVKDIRGDGNPQITEMTAVGNSLYFSATDGVNGFALWKSDGTFGGTAPVVQVSESFGPRQLTAVGDTLYFTAWDGATNDLWRAVGGTANKVKDFNDIDDPGSLHNFNGTLYFLGVNTLWKSDGTELGTVLVKNFGGDPNIGANGTGLMHVGGTMYFSGFESVHGSELWASDGTEGGTRMVKDIREGTDGDGFGLSSGVGSLTDANGILYFAASDGAGGAQLWRSDGTEAGTILVHGANGDPQAPGVAFITNLDGVVFYNADNGINGPELYMAGAGIQGAVLFDILPGNPGSYPAFLTRMGDAIYFRATTPDKGTELLKVTLVDPPPAGTVSIEQSAYTAGEGGGDAVITLLRTGGGAGAVSVLLKTANDTAAAGGDYTAVNQVVAWADGDTAPKTVKIPIKNDTAFEPTEMFWVSIGNPTGGVSLGANLLASVTVIDNDPNLVRLARITPKVSGGVLKTLTISFAGLPNPAQKIDPNAIYLVRAGKDKKLGTKDDLITRFTDVKIDVAKIAVVLTAPAKVAIKDGYSVRIDGGRIKDMKGRGVDADKNGKPGGVRFVPVTSKVWKET